MANISVSLVDDHEPEADETFIVLLSNPNKAVLADDMAVAVIIDNDNIRPTANAGLDQTVNEGDTVTLDGSGASDLDDGIASYRWMQISGVSITLSDPNAINPTLVTPSVESDDIIIVFQLTVEDNWGAQDSDEVSITIHDNGITTYQEGVITFISSTNKDMGVMPGNSNHIIGLTPVDLNSIIDTTNRQEYFTYGLIDIGLRAGSLGATATVTFYLPEPAPEGYKWYKYTETGGWIDFSRGVISGGNGDGAEFNDERTQVTLYITDNGPYDDNPMT